MVAMNTKVPVMDAVDLLPSGGGGGAAAGVDKRLTQE